MSEFESGGDVAFHVPLTHRVRFTRDCLGAERDVLLDLLEPSAGQPARVQFWLDEGLHTARPELAHRLRTLVDHDPRRRIQRVGNVQLVPGGEAVKNDIHILERILKVFHAARLDRRSYVVVVGGGAVLDTVGFAAAIAHRGLRLVRLPTTTLAQADSGIGVKNAVNLFGKKNWIGSFAVPWAVVNDAALLETLPHREFRAGFSEAVKVALLKDAVWFDELCRAARRIAERDMSAALPAIERSAHWHLRHITQGGDPFEMREARPLDFGHWSAHRLEPLSDFSVRHGEAVAIGVAIDVVYSSLAHGLPQKRARRVLRCLSELGFDLHHEALCGEALFEGLEEFRQHLGGRLTLTMLKDIGRPIDVHRVDRALMRRAMRIVSRYAEKRTRSDRRPR